MWLNVIWAKLNMRSQLSHWSSNGSCKQWHPGPLDSSTGALDKHHLLVIYSHPCGFIVATFEAARIFCCSMIIYSDPTGHAVTMGHPLMAWYVFVLFSGVGSSAWKVCGPWSHLHPCSQALNPPSTLEGWVW